MSSRRRSTDSARRNSRRFADSDRIPDPGSRRNLSLLGILEVGITLEAVLVELEEPARLLVADLPFPHGELDVVPKLPDKGVCIELDIVEDFLDGVSLDHG